MILFTSGSTGRPKSIMYQHSSIRTSLLILASSLDLKNSCRVAQFTSYSFDLRMIEILLPLLVGGCVCIPSAEDKINNMTDYFKRMQISFTMLTPSSVKLLIPTEPTVTKIMVGGEPITSNVINTWGHDVELLNAWGTTECGTCTYAVV